MPQTTFVGPQWDCGRMDFDFLPVYFRPKLRCGVWCLVCPVPPDFIPTQDLTDLLFASAIEAAAAGQKVLLPEHLLVALPHILGPHWPVESKPTLEELLGTPIIGKDVFQPSVQQLLVTASYQARLEGRYAIGAIDVLAALCRLDHLPLHGWLLAHRVCEKLPI